MAAEYLEINPDNPQENRLEEAVEIIRKGGVVIYPTDTVYGMGCDLYNTKAITRLCQLKGIKPSKMNLSFMCYDLSDISTYVKRMDNSVFKIMKKALPGPYTFILEASSQVPKIIDAKKKNVGIRVPDHTIPRELVRLLGNPIITASIKDEDEVLEYSTDPSLIHEKYQNLVDLVIDGGFGGNVASTVIDCTSGEVEVVREGLGSLDIL